MKSIALNCSCVESTKLLLRSLKASNKEITFATAPIDAYLQGAKAQGMPDDIAWLINELFVNVLDGRNENTTNTIETVLGRPAKGFQDYVLKTVRTGVWA